VLSLGFVVV